MKLSDAERSKIRWSSTKRGYVVRAEFVTRTGRKCRPLRSSVVCTHTEAVREMKRMQSARWTASMTQIQIIEVDALGNEPV